MSGNVTTNSVLFRRHGCSFFFFCSIQFSFGVAAAVVADMDHVPEKMQLVFDDRFRDFDWYLYVNTYAHTHTHTHIQACIHRQVFLPPPSYAAS